MIPSKNDVWEFASIPTLEAQWISHQHCPLEICQWNRYSNIESQVFGYGINAVS